MEFLEKQKDYFKFKITRKLYKAGIKPYAHQELNLVNQTFTRDDAIGVDKKEAALKETDGFKNITKNYILDEIETFEKTRDVIFDETQKQAILILFYMEFQLLQVDLELAKLQ